MGRIAALASVALCAVTATACGSEGGSTDAPEAVRIVVTTTILQEAVTAVVGDAADVEVIVPPGTSPHDFQASARDADRMRQADALVANGAGFEEGLIEVLEAAAEDGVPLHEAISAVDALPAEGAGDAHGGDEHHGDVDAHFFTDPVRMAQATEGIAQFLASEVPGLDAGEIRERAQSRVEELQALDAEIEAILAPVPAQRRVLVTSHDVLDYFADRYGFEVAGTVVTGGGTGDAVGAGALAELAALLDARSVPAVFVDASASSDLAGTLAAESGGVEVVELHTESLGPEGSEAATYVGMMRLNARRIAEALAG